MVWSRPQNIALKAKKYSYYPQKYSVNLFLASLIYDPSQGKELGEVYVRIFVLYDPQYTLKLPEKYLLNKIKKY